ncbi:hypothetical protein GGTG_06840 [Gaeumannomyces tritici R3-111a-1]|uniref:Uncharacterized protein n=1 Tax=Gaeumannomyces tritici (strain R3-111a-1) TaxID=644352 RepID=J3NZZ3_GAET3|nr:hypothetical protein GGTG_06840 [Gaeumannomyces tritici R3-111a-1]EJT76926.1 hypothetical protein GGTG_06840 [Gaeumannomyces tritici R3-111a-1]
MSAVNIKKNFLFKIAFFAFFVAVTFLLAFYIMLISCIALINGCNEKGILLFVKDLTSFLLIFFQFQPFKVGAYCYFNAILTAIGFLIFRELLIACFITLLNQLIWKLLRASVHFLSALIFILYNKG